MILLYIFAFISGILTILAPCIWPLLPIILSSTTTGEKQKPLGITLGVMISFGFFTLAISYIVHLIPFDTNILRIFAAFIIGFLGLTLIIPRLNQIVEGTVSRISGKFGNKKPANTESTGFGVGLLTGLSLGVVWAPCAGPILATIATLAGSQKVTFDVVIVTFFYVIGVGIPLFAFATFGSKLFKRSKVVNRHLGTIQKIFGVIMILTALAIITNTDKTIETKLLSIVPSYTNALTSIEKTSIVTSGLNALKGDANAGPVIGKAPDFLGVDKWLNTNGKTLHMSGLKGKVVLVDFWTYTCINCIRTLPHVVSWYNTYKNDGFVVVGVHTPEFQFEHDTGNVQNAIKQFGITYPVAQDNEYATWNAYNNEYWPAEYLIDANGNIRKTDFGEGGYSEMETAIKDLLQEAGKTVTVSAPIVMDQTPSGVLTQETYLGYGRGQAIVGDENLQAGTNDFETSMTPSIGQFALHGTFDIKEQYITPQSKSSLDLNFYAGKVFLVLHPKISGALIGVTLDGKVITADQAGSDIKNGYITTDVDRLYNVVNLQGKEENHTLHFNFLSNDVDVYVFTFG